MSIWLKSSGELTVLLTSEDTLSGVAVGMPKRRRKKNAPKKWRTNDDGVGPPVYISSVFVLPAEVKSRPRVEQIK